MGSRLCLNFSSPCYSAEFFLNFSPPRTFDHLSLSPRPHSLSYSSSSTTCRMVAPHGYYVQQPCGFFFYRLLLARAHTLRNCMRRFLLLILLFVSVFLQHMQLSKGYNGPLAGVWWRLRNAPLVESMWLRTMTFIAPAALDSDWVYQQVNFCPIGMYAFLRWVESLQYKDQLYAWHVVTGVNGVRRFLSKFRNTDSLVGRCDPADVFLQLKDTLDIMKQRPGPHAEHHQLRAIAVFRKAFFNTASSICLAITKFDTVQLKRIIYTVFPPMRECVAGLLQLTTEPSSTKLEAARVAMSRWIRKLFRLDFAFLCLCPTVPSALLDYYLNLGKGYVPSEVAAVAILENIPVEWRNDEFLKVAIPATALTLDNNG